MTFIGSFNTYGMLYKVTVEWYSETNLILRGTVIPF